MARRWRLAEKEGPTVWDRIQGCVLGLFVFRWQWLRSGSVEHAGSLVQGKLCNTVEWRRGRKAKSKPQVCKFWVVPSLDWCKESPLFTSVSVLEATSTSTLLRTRCCGWTADIHQAHLQLISWVKTTGTGETKGSGQNLTKRRWSELRDMPRAWFQPCRPPWWPVFALWPSQQLAFQGFPNVYAKAPNWHRYEEWDIEIKVRKQTRTAHIDSCGLSRVCLCTSQPWKAVLSLKVEAIQYAIVWIIDDWFLSNQCPHKTMHSLAPWWRERAWPVFVPMPLEAKGKSFNALKPLEVLPLKDSPWNQLGWCVSPYEGAHQSGLPVKGVRGKWREMEQGRMIESLSERVCRNRKACECI